MSSKLSVVVAAYNEQERIPVLLSEMEIFCKEHPDIVGELLIVDDGSKDGTVEVCMRYMTRLPLRVVRVVKNGGKWSALHVGLVEAKYEHILLMDADYSVDIRTLLEIDLQQVCKDKKVVLASRFMKGAEVIGKGGLRQVVSWGYRVYSLFWYWVATGRHDVSDMQCPFKLVHRSQIQHRLLRVDRFAGDIELLCYMSGERMNVPVRFIHRAGSHVRIGAILDMAWETMKIAWRKRFRI